MTITRPNTVDAPVTPTGEKGVSALRGAVGGPSSLEGTRVTAETLGAPVAAGRAPRMS
jgi:hypothetical protein